MIGSAVDFLWFLIVVRLFTGHCFLIFRVILSSNSPVFASVPTELSPLTLILVGEYISKYADYLVSRRYASIPIDAQHPFIYD